MSLSSIVPSIERARSAMERALTKDDPTPEVTQGLRELVAARDTLIRLRRLRASDIGPMLDRLNSFVSHAFGAEYPLVGVHRDRIEAVRRELGKLLELQRGPPGS